MNINQGDKVILILYFTLKNTWIQNKNTFGQASETRKLFSYMCIEIQVLNQLK